MVLILSFLLAATSQPSGEAAVLATVQRLLDAMAARDAATIGAVLLPKARITSVRAGKVTYSTAADFAARIAAAKEPPHERIREPNIQIHGDVAHLWAPYTFQRGDSFSHCGTDSISLVKTPDGWKIAGLAYTVETTGCGAPQ
jgi:ketosteroid isomerase-like protein